MIRPYFMHYQKIPQDLLSDILTPLRLQGVFISDWHMRSPWSVQGEPESCALIHYLLQGQAHIRTDDQQEYHLNEGDLAIFPHGAAHIVTDNHTTKPIPLASILPHRRTGEMTTINFGGTGTPARMLCSGLHYDTIQVLPLYELLPPVLIIRASTIDNEPLLKQNLMGIQSEIMSAHEGRNIIILRSIELIYIIALSVAIKDASIAGDLAVMLLHPNIGLALKMIYQHYPQKITLTELAKKAGMSRSGFAQQFKKVTGTSPMRHLALRRLAQAKHLLDTTTLSQEKIAQAVGYESAVGLNLAFKSHLGVSTGTFRNKKNSLHVYANY